MNCRDRALAIAVYICMLFANSITTPREKVVAVLKPVFNAKDIVVLNATINPYTPFGRHDLVSVRLQKRGTQYQIAKGVRAWKNCSTYNFAFSRSGAVKVGDFFFRKELCLGARSDFDCGRPPNIFEGDTDDEGLTDCRDN